MFRRTEVACTWVVTIIVSPVLASHVSSAPWSDYLILVVRMLAHVFAVHAEICVVLCKTTMVVEPQHEWEHHKGQVVTKHV